MFLKLAKYNVSVNLGSNFGSLHCYPHRKWCYGDIIILSYLIYGGVYFKITDLIYYMSSNGIWFFRVIEWSEVK